MITFAADKVRKFAEEMGARLEKCSNEEGMACESIDKFLTCHASECHKLIEAVRKWGRDVFAGQIAYDRAAELQWLTSCQEFYAQFVEVLPLGMQAEEECCEISGQQKLQSALFRLGRLLDSWVSPKLSVGPSARQKISLGGASEAEIKERMDRIPRLPLNWPPTDMGQTSQQPA